MKPELIEVLEIVMMKDEATKLYDEIDRRIAVIKKECGAGRYDYDLSILYSDTGNEAESVEFGIRLREDAQYLKLEIVDNVAKMAKGESVWKSTPFKPVSFSSASLKRCPDSLKGI